MEDKEFYNLSSKVNEINVSIERDTKHIEHIIDSLEKKIDDDLKPEIWDLKTNIKKISQNEKDIAVLIEKSENNAKLLESYKKELEAKMVTKQYLEDKKYKDWRIWMVGIGLLVAIGFGAFNSYYIFNKNSIGEKENVLPNTKK